MSGIVWILPSLLVIKVSLVLIMSLDCQHSDGFYPLLNSLDSGMRVILFKIFDFRSNGLDIDFLSIRAKRSLRLEFSLIFILSGSMVGDDLEIHVGFINDGLEGVDNFFAEVDLLPFVNHLFFGVEC